MRPIVWGLILTVLGGFSWILLARIELAELASGGVPPLHAAFLHTFEEISGLMLYLSLPVALIVEVYHYLKKGRAKRT